MKCVIDRCLGESVSRGLCNMHRHRRDRNGTTDLLRKPSLDERFWAKVVKGDECWVWAGSRSREGYGRFRGANSVMVVATKQSLLLAGVEVPQGSIVMHLCDNPPCVRPEHLKVGSHRDNNVDMTKKGRARYAKGGQLPQAKLSESDVRAIKSDGRSLGEIADEYNVSKSCIFAIRSGRSWKHVNV